jgi:hypothetical protein
MAKADKKVAKLKERLAIMEAELLNALTKKSSTTSEINVPEYTRKIKELKAQIASA